MAGPFGAQPFTIQIEPIEGQADVLEVLLQGHLEERADLGFAVVHLRLAAKRLDVDRLVVEEPDELVKTAWTCLHRGEVAFDRVPGLLAGIARGGLCHARHGSRAPCAEARLPHVYDRNIPRRRASSAAATPTAIHPAAPPTSGGQPVPTSHAGVGRTSKKSRPSVGFETFWKF